MREPFPLQWPEGWKRTRADMRLRSHFGFRQSGQVPFGHARSELLAELDRLGAANVIITSDLPTRGDGLPYASGRATDPGIAVWFVLPDERGNQQERVFACDKWLSHAENMQAIAKSIAAMRGLDRWGAGDVVSRAFAGFNALPPGSDETTPAAPAKRTWREVLGETFGPWPDALLGRDELLVIARARHRKLIQLHHPDRGGSHEKAAELNAAIGEAEADLGGAA